MIRITEKHTGKMEGMKSLSTNTLTNPLCQVNRKIKGSICEKCYANQYAKMRPNLAKKLEENTQALTKEIIKEDEIPLINSAFFRFEAFGDIYNEIHLENYLKIAKKNPHCRFGLWTKNYPLILNYFFDHKLPDNINLILSSLMVNKCINLDPFKKMGIKVKSFTVYSRAYAKEHGVTINCGSRSCISCLQCYKENDIECINELLKSDRKRKEVK